jgi:hypothetical protein
MIAVPCQSNHEACLVKAAAAMVTEEGAELLLRLDFLLIVTPNDNGRNGH